MGDTAVALMSIGSSEDTQQRVGDLTTRAVQDAQNVTVLVLGHVQKSAVCPRKRTSESRTPHVR